MANRRMLSKSISTSKRLSRVSDFAALLFTWIIPHCDDAGNMDGDPVTVKGTIMPIRDKTVKEVKDGLDELAKEELINFYAHKKDTFLHIDKWSEHQTFRADRVQYKFPLEGRKPKVTKRKPIVTKTPTEFLHQGLTAFRKINLSFERLFSNGNQRMAMDRLIQKHGLTKMLNVINSLSYSNSRKYAPTIITPYELEAKLSTLVAFYQKEKDGGKKGKEILGL